MEECPNKQDIFTFHAPLIHTAREIKFQLNYKNNDLDAQIISIGHKNVQMALESYFSQTGIPIKREVPSGEKNNQNLQFLTQYEFIGNSLEVFLSGMQLNGNPNDVNRDFDIISTGINKNKGFIIRVDSTKWGRLKCPPLQNEELVVNYSKRITFNTKGGS